MRRANACHVDALEQHRALVHVDLDAADALRATYDRRGECVAAEQRFLVTSIPTGTVTRDEELALVRMHWGSRTAATGRWT